MKASLTAVALTLVLALPAGAQEDPTAACTQEATDAGIVDETEFKQYVAECVDEMRARTATPAEGDQAPTGREGAPE